MSPPFPPGWKRAVPAGLSLRGRPGAYGGCAPRPVRPGCPGDLCGRAGGVPPRGCALGAPSRPTARLGGAADALRCPGGLPREGAERRRLQGLSRKNRGLRIHAPEGGKSHQLCWWLLLIPREGGVRPAARVGFRQADFTMTILPSRSTITLCSSSSSASA